ncbi:MAG: ribbon-helix-helix domain-containing protein [Chloroflexota bacterium]
MKVSVSLPKDDVEFLDRYAKGRGFASRSAALHQAVKQLRVTELEAEYEAAFIEWEESGEAALWDSTAGDGIENAPW